MIQKHFVTFFSPGTFVSETSEKPIEAWDVEAAKALAVDIHERHNARPYGFRFTTRSRGDDDLDSRVTATSPLYYLGGTIRTLEDVERDDRPEEKILRSNMRNNDIKRVVENNNSWRFTGPLNDDDVVLDFAFPARAEQAVG